MKIGRIALAAIVCAGSALAVAAGCSAEPGERRPPSLAMPAATSSGLPLSGASLGSNAPSFDVESFTPVLALPELRSALAAFENSDFAGAARELQRAMAERPPEATLVRSYQFLLGRLRERAGDLVGAAASYELAAATRWPLSGYARLGAGRSLLRAGHAKEALDRLRQVPASEPCGEDAELLVAEAASLVGDRSVAIGALRALLARGDAKANGVLASTRLAEALLEDATTQSSPDTRLSCCHEALTLSRRAAAHAPTDVDIVSRSEKVQARALSLLPSEERAALARPSPEEELDRVRALEDGRQHDAARFSAEQLLARIGPHGRTSAVGCEASLIRAKALGGAREWGKGSDAAADVARRCTDRDLQARALFLAGKYADSDKRFALATTYYEALEKEHSDHRLADDARLRAALSFRELGADARFTDLLGRMADDYPAGDMVLDGMFELALRRIEKGDWTSALSVLDRATQVATAGELARGQEFAGRERYFRARAVAMLGDVDRSLAEYEAIVSELPLSYYMLHAYSRLYSADSARATRALETALARGQKDPFRFERGAALEYPGFVRALELLRVGDVEDAEREIDVLGAQRAETAPAVLWAVASLYARAGSAKLSHAVARSLLTEWVGRWPSGEWARAWELAFPRPYREIVEREAKKNSVPEYFVYAVMREESSFDPEAQSPANAYGLMQIIEPTARRFAKPIGLRADPDSLRKPGVNVAIGCRVLADLVRTFSGNPLLAIPGYNAGPARPRRWLDEHAGVDFDVWVELISFTETRRYTKRVLASRAAYAFLYSSDHELDALRLPIKTVAENSRP
jgi:soluble lytic murein transglycosylase